MQYGYFDERSREYVITRPDTPRVWSNYLGSRRYGGIITPGAGGYSFTRSPAEGRILRHRYNSVPAELPGRQFYLRDRDSGAPCSVMALLNRDVQRRRSAFQTIPG